MIGDGKGWAEVLEVVGGWLGYTGCVVFTIVKIPLNHFIQLYIIYL